jgi:hypothetical protein
MSKSLSSLTHRSIWRNGWTHSASTISNQISGMSFLRMLPPSLVLLHASFDIFQVLLCHFLHASLSGRMQSLLVAVSVDTLLCGYLTDSCAAFVCSNVFLCYVFICTLALRSGLSFRYSMLCGISCSPCIVICSTPALFGLSYSPSAYYCPFQRMAPCGLRILLYLASHLLLQVLACWCIFLFGHLLMSCCACLWFFRSLHFSSDTVRCSNHSNLLWCHPEHLITDFLGITCGILYNT